MRKYSTAFSKLTRLILNMSDVERTILLKQAQKIINNRKKYRTPCLIPAYYCISETSYVSYILDINDYGAFIETDERFPIGQNIQLKYYNPFSRKPINLKGEIVWSSSDGIGVRFKYFLYSQFDPAEPVFDRENQKALNFKLPAEVNMNSK
jgi:hypothetical protein